MSFDPAAAETAAREALRMPPGHPESLTVELPGADEEMLAELCTLLWPADEYAEITAGDWDRRNRGYVMIIRLVRYFRDREPCFCSGWPHVCWCPRSRKSTS